MTGCNLLFSIKRVLKSESDESEARAEYGWLIFPLITQQTSHRYLIWQTSQESTSKIMSRIELHCPKAVGWILWLIIVALSFAGPILTVLGGICVGQMNSEKATVEDWCPSESTSLAMLIIGCILIYCCGGLGICKICRRHRRASGNP